MKHKNKNNEKLLLFAVAFLLLLIAVPSILNFSIVEPQNTLPSNPITDLVNGIINEIIHFFQVILSLFGF